MSAVVEAISNAGSAIADTVSHAVNVTADRVDKLVTDIGNDPVQAIAVVASVMYPPAAPFIMAGNAVAHGASLEQAVTAAAVSYVGGQVGSYVGGNLSNAAEQAAAAAKYGLDAGSQQAAMIAAQEAGMGSLVDPWSQAVISATRSGVRNATGAALTGGNPAAAFTDGFTSSAYEQGAGAVVNTAGGAVNGWLQNATAERDVNGMPIPGTGVSVGNLATSVNPLLNPEGAVAEIAGGELGLSSEQVRAGMSALSAAERLDSQQSGGGGTRTRRQSVADGYFYPTQARPSVTGPGNVNEDAYAANGYDASWYDSLNGTPNEDNLSSSLLKYLDTIGQSPVGDASKVAQRSRMLQRRPSAAGPDGSISSMLGGSYSPNQAGGFDSFADWADASGADEKTTNRFYG